MLLSLLITLAIVVVCFVVVVSLRSSDFRIVRSTTVSAPAEDVFVQINDLHRYEVWNPWGKFDPAMKSTFDGSRTGRGAILSWAGNNRVGSGRMTISESQPNNLVRIRLDFFKPFPSTATAEFTFKTISGRQTEVTWTMIGKHAFIPKAMSLFMSMDKMIGGEFEKGLAEMKSIVEARPADSAPLGRVAVNLT